MSTIRTTRRLLTAYADRESWKSDHDEVQSYYDVEEKLAWGAHLYQGLLDLEARTQAHAFKRPGPAIEQILEIMPLFYQLWTQASEFYLAHARELAGKGYEVGGIDDFQRTVEEARCLLGNLDLEEEIRPIDELIRQSHPANPRPERYGA